MLATHVVRTLQHMAQRRPPQHIGCAPLIRDTVGEIRMTTRQQFKFQRC